MGIELSTFEVLAGGSLLFTGGYLLGWYCRKRW